MKSCMPLVLASLLLLMTFVVKAAPKPERADTTVASASSAPAAGLVGRMGRGNRLLVGLGTGNEISQIQSQALQPDIYSRYLPDYPGFSWTQFNSPPGHYVDVVAAAADSIGAVPMFTIYQIIIGGENNPATLSNLSLMQDYWDHTVLLFDRLAVYNKPALINIEPDFWGYAYNFSPSHDPTQKFAHVQITPDCAHLPNNVRGMAQCFLAIARKRAPKALLGFPPSDFGFGTQNVINFMNDLGADEADFIVMQTMDRDAGCFEIRGPECSRSGSDWYWGQAQYDAHFAEARQYHEGIGGLPLVWWQTPMGVPSLLFGGTHQRWRDNRVDYFLRHPQQIVDAGGAAVVFGKGASNQTGIATDGGHFQERWSAYIGAPTPLIDDVPDTFVFHDRVDRPTAARITSNTVQVTGINGPVTVTTTVPGDSARIIVNGGTAQQGPVTIDNGDTLQINVLSAAAPNTSREVTVSIGSAESTWMVSTGDEDTTPGPISFTNVANAEQRQIYRSETLTLQRFNSPTSIQIRGANTAMYSINSGPFTRASGTVAPGDTLQLQLESAGVAGVTRRAIVVVGRIRGRWEIGTSP